MKTYSIIVAAALAFMALQSCKKAWVCQCTNNSGESTYHEIPNATLGDARTTCNNFEYSAGVVYNNCSIIE